MHRLNGRVHKLEMAVKPPRRRRLWQVCKRQEETLADSLARHGIEPAPQDKIIVHRYGCPVCRPRRVHRNTHYESEDPRQES